MPVSMRSHFHYWKDIINQKFPFFTKVTIGESPDYIEIDADCSYKMYGDTTVWDDIQNTLIGNKIDSPAGTVALNYAENSVTFEPNGSLTDSTKRVGFNIQMPHNALPTTKLHVHVHWKQTDATARTWAIRYRVQLNGETAVTSWTTVSVSTAVGNVFPYVSGTFNQITDLAEIDLGAGGLSTIIEIQFARTDSASGNVDATFIDCHYQKDSLGSKEEYVK